MKSIRTGLPFKIARETVAPFWSTRSIGGRQSAVLLDAKDPLDSVDDPFEDCAGVSGIGVVLVSQPNPIPLSTAASARRNIAHMRVRRDCAINLLAIRILK